MYKKLKTSLTLTTNAAEGRFVAKSLSEILSLEIKNFYSLRWTLQKSLNRPNTKEILFIKSIKSQRLFLQTQAVRNWICEFLGCNSEI